MHLSHVAFRTPAQIQRPLEKPRVSERLMAAQAVCSAAPHLRGDPDVALECDARLKELEEELEYARVFQALVDSRIACALTPPRSPFDCEEGEM
jgi:hypothetical protein